MSALEISIIIPAFNEDKNIVRCLKSIYEQAPHNIHFEVIIVDDCSTDNTLAEVNLFCSSKNIEEIRVIRNPVNRGRFKTRLEGINASKHALILFVDSKVTLANDAFNRICEINYTPLIATNTIPAQQNIIERAYYLIRKKAYRGNYPKLKSNSILLTPENFDTMPKGTTTFLCDKALLLENLPFNTDKNSSDDTAWLNCITKAKPIMINNTFEFTYHPREEKLAILEHLFLRGPKFVDYYYRPGTFYFRLINAALIIALLTLSLLMTDSFFRWAPLVILLVLLISAAGYLAENLIDFVRMFAVLPLLISTFGMGALYGLFVKCCKATLR